MLDKVKANASKGNPNVLSCEIAKTMLHSVVVRRTQLVELAVRQDATMEIPDGRGGTSICDLLLRAIPMSILLELECLTAACKAFSLANAKGKGINGLVIGSLD
jgi:hypothetical protein